MITLNNPGPMFSLLTLCRKIYESTPADLTYILSFFGFYVDVIRNARTGFKFAAFFCQALAPSIKTWEETCPESKGHDDTVDGRNPKQPPGMYKTL